MYKFSRKMTISGYFFYIIYSFLCLKQSVQIIQKNNHLLSFFLHNLYISVWIQHGNTGFLLDPSNTVIKRLWCIYLCLVIGQTCLIKQYRPRSDVTFMTFNLDVHCLSLL